MKKILIDLGANNGCSLRKFSKELDDFANLEVYSFEPGTIAESKEMKETLKKYPNITLYKSAVSNHNNNIDFFEHSVYSEASTTWSNKANDTKRRGDCGSDIKGEVIKKTVSTINIINFIKNLVENNNTDIILKCDIEGEEYNIIPDMISESLFKYITTFYVEWHEEWNNTNKSKNYLVSQIRNQNQNILILDWNASGY